jgi:hypothetical protein
MSEKTTNLSAFKRVLGYVWPQWPSLIAVFFWAMLIAGMLSVSFLTIIPLLKVMMEEEGLHGWVDRKVCNWRYGMDFYVPSRTDFFDTTSGKTKYLLINRIEEGKWASRVGLQRGDQIFSVAVGGQTEQTMSLSRILRFWRRWIRICRL